MEHKGIRFEILQTLPKGWRWVVHLEEGKVRTGFSPSKGAAVFKAVRVIDESAKK